MHSPPKWAEWLLNKILPEHLEEEVAGDLSEAFFWRIEEKGHRKARFLYIWEVFKASRFISQKSQNNYTSMLLSNYLKTGFRFLWKTRTYSSFNIFGLAIGLAAAWLATGYVYDEMIYDDHFTNVDRMYRIVADYEHNGLHHIGGGSYVMAEEYGKQIPGIESITQYKPWYHMIRSGEGIVPFVSHRVNPSIFNILDFEFYEGGYQSFDRPDVAIVSSSLYSRLESQEEIEIITYRGESRRFQIIGVYRDIPDLSSVKPELLIPIENYAIDNSDRLATWFDINMNVIMTLNPGTDPTQVESLMTEILLENDEFTEATVNMRLQPFSEIHTSEVYETGNGIRRGLNTEFVYLIIVVGAVCLVLSIINFGNFAVSNYLGRLREIGVRKVFGAGRNTIFYQFMIEIFMSTLFAVVLAFILLVSTMPLLSEYLDRSINPGDWITVKYLLIGIGIMCLATILTALYPALLLSKQKLTIALKGKALISGKGALSKSLLIVQFALASSMILGMAVFGQQLKMLVEFDPGFSVDNVIQVSIPNPDEQILENFKQEMLAIPGINSVSRFSGNNRTNYSTDSVDFLTFHTRVDEDYLSMLDIKMVNGRMFDPSNSLDQRNAIIVNETFAKMAGLGTAIGQSIPFNYGELENPVVIGVVKDYHFLDLRSQVQPLVLYMSPQYTYNQFLIEAASDNFQFLELVEDRWQEHFAPFPFNYTSLEDLRKEQYELESQIKDMANLGAFIALLLTSMGLMGVVGTHVRQRLKEVSIRKVNGASPGSILGWIARKYVFLVLFGILLGLGTAYFYLDEWLQQYIIVVPISTGLILITALVVGSVTFLAIYSQLHQAMYMNPVKYLRDE